MKKTLTKLSAISFVVYEILAVACGGNPSKQLENSAAFDSVRLSGYSGYTAVAVTHEVGDYKTWLNAYTNLSNPASRLSVYASPEDPNLVTVFELTKSHEDAKTVFASPQFRESLQEEGVTSDPVFNFFDVKFRSLTPTIKNYRVGVSHEVADYERWKKLFDEDESTRAKANLELRAISTNADNPKMVNILFATDDFQKAKDVINSDELRKRMTEAGVKSEPVIIVFQVPGEGISIN